MLNTELLMTTLRLHIEKNTSLEKVYSPDLPQEKTNIACVTMLGGTPNNNLCKMSDYDVTFRVLIRGTNNDTNTRALADEVFNLLHMAQDIEVGDNKITFILATTTPIYVGKDENQNNLYNITFRANIS